MHPWTFILTNIEVSYQLIDDSRIATASYILAAVTAIVAFVAWKFYGTKKRYVISIAVIAVIFAGLGVLSPVLPNDYVEKTQSRINMDLKKVSNMYGVPFEDLQTVISLQSDEGELSDPSCVMFDTTSEPVLMCIQRNVTDVTPQEEATYEITRVTFRQLNDEGTDEMNMSSTPLVQSYEQFVEDKASS